MAISPIVLNGTIQQTHEVLQDQTKETQKPVQDQVNIQMQEVRQEQQKAQEVVKYDKSEFMEERYDAKDKGKGSYQGDGGRRRRKEPEGRVVVKPSGGFDMKI